LIQVYKIGELGYWKGGDSEKEGCTASLVSKFIEETLRFIEKRAMEDFKRNRTAPAEEQEATVKSASEQRAEISHQERTSQSETNGSTDTYNYDEYDSYSPWG
jgi:hypothetical protein